MIQRRIIGHKSISPEAWKEASGPVLLAVHQLMRLATQDLAQWDGFRLLVPNAAASRFDAGLSTVLGLPGEAPVVAKIGLGGSAHDALEHRVRSLRYGAGCSRGPQIISVHWRASELLRSRNPARLDAFRFGNVIGDSWRESHVPGHSVVPYLPLLYRPEEIGAAIRVANNGSKTMSRCGYRRPRGQQWHA
jgi:hypothetical protein